MAKQPEKDDDIILSVQVTLHPNDEIANKWRCPIANSIKESDPDIHHVTADEHFIRYSRYSTGMRYTHWTPKDGKRFIKKLDVLARKDPDTLKASDFPKGFQLDLMRSSLAGEQPVSNTKGLNANSARSRNKVAMTQKLKVEKDADKPVKRGSHSRRFIPVLSD